jgi:hypothetical protein
MHVLSSMFDNMRSLMLPHIGALVQILTTNLSHAHTLVRRGALQVLSSSFKPLPLSQHVCRIRQFKRLS